MGHVKRRLIRIGIAGGIGGAVNALLCYLSFPMPVKDAHFHWHLIPAGMLHGSLLGLCAVGANIILKKYGTMIRIVAAIAVGWLGGYLSWIPLNMSLSTDHAWFIESLEWPFKDDSAASFLWVPFFYFGIVVALFYLWLSREKKREGVLAHVVVVALAGVAGSLWWWVSWEPWYFSLLHGTIWGGFTGYGFWRSDQ